MPIKFVPLDTPKILEYLKGTSYYVIGTLPGEHYPGVTRPVRTIGVKALLVTQDREPADAVYDLVKTLAENFDAVKASHSSLRALKPEDLMKGLVGPVHPGAERYYRERKWLN